MSGYGSAGGALIVTAELPPALQARMNALRQAHFPPERNYLSAHVTLFHALPPSCEAELREVLARLAAGPAPDGQVEGVMSLGRGTAIRLASPALLALREGLAERFWSLLSAQDQHRPRLHVTVQNKVTPAAAKALQAQLGAEIRAEAFRFAGLGLHVYAGGPWSHVKSWPFRG
ncbi:hypothetical protein PK98_03080 [Croceibacterium mercuriale]|uniref:Phosphoesterase HXTX n=1 Tax=Croceibacterium mercuriale TaxID=1572751 RepID=A0A0B2C107_9SPHN|nr:2'-5' RNA ligase family protein [Croceibacterium mercuriale]KHL25651.1 hypothetical protein PK98_03080 [Croceibacterium mercuriale]